VLMSIFNPKIMLIIIILSHLLSFFHDLNYLCLPLFLIVLFRMLIECLQTIKSFIETNLLCWPRFNFEGLAWPYLYSLFKLLLNLFFLFFSLVII
jgi:hypothetical protein